MTHEESRAAFLRPMHEWHAMTLEERRAAWIAGVEGGAVDDPADAGGPTIYGISSAQYGWETPPSWDEAMAIYTRDYWDAHRCGEMAPGWGLAMFDSTVLHARGVRLVQAALGVAVDGIVGEQTIGATHALRGNRDAYADLLRGRWEYVQTVGSFPVHASGWFRRFSLQAAMALTLDEGPPKPLLPQRFQLPWVR